MGVITEQSIRKFSAYELRTFLIDLKNNLPDDVFCNIKYAVIQSGVGLNLGTQKNTGLLM